MPIAASRSTTASPLTPGTEQLVIAKNTPKLPSTTHIAHNATRSKKYVGMAKVPNLPLYRIDCRENDIRFTRQISQKIRLKFERKRFLQMCRPGTLRRIRARPFKSSRNWQMRGGCVGAGLLPTPPRRQRSETMDAELVRCDSRPGLR